MDEIVPTTELVPAASLPELAERLNFQVLRRPRPLGGEQTLARFANGYGISAVRGIGTYGTDSGLWELAVLQFNGPGWEDFELTYDTPITDDVIGWLDEAEVAAIAQRVAALDGAR
jgi:hypothetical protein